MRLCSKFLIHNLKLYPQQFPSKLSLFSHGKYVNKFRDLSSFDQLGPHYESTPTTKPCSLIAFLRESSASRSLLSGQLAHSRIVKAGFDSDIYMANNLLNVYAKCGSVSDARQLFDEMRMRDVVSWNTMISGFVLSGSHQEGLCFFRWMKRSGFRPTQSSFASILVASAELGSLKLCWQIQVESVKCGLVCDCCIGNALMTAYVGLGRTRDAREIFDKLCNFDEVSIEILSSGYVQSGNADGAFELFKHSCLEGIVVSCFTLSSLISLAANVGLINSGIQMHGHVVKAGMDSDVSIVNSLITMYSRSCLLEDALFLFNCLALPDVVTWNSLIGGHAYSDLGDTALSLVGKLFSSGVRMNESTFSSILSSCASITVLENAKKAHVLILKLRQSVDQKN